MYLRERLADVRKRFTAKLPSRIAAIDHAPPALAGDGGEVAAAVYSVHRQVHDLCGIGPTPGFLATARRRESVKKSYCNRPVANAGLLNGNWRV
jgi:hypothetical protein